MTAREREWPITQSNAMLPPSGYGAPRGCGPWAAFVLASAPNANRIKQPKASASTIQQRENRADVLPQKPGSLLRRKVVVKVP